MKKIIFSIALLICAIADIMAQNNAMYVYRNDGVINAFLKSDIDSIRHSNLDLDSIAHQDYVVQEVWTVDSIYRIPLAVIDSVSFVTPPTIYKEDATVIDEYMLDYIIGADSLTLYFKKDTPKNFLPKVQDKLIFMNISENLPHGFLGQVEEIQDEEDRISFICSSLLLTDVFEQYYSFSVGTITDTDPKVTRAKNLNTTWGPLTYTTSKHTEYPEITASIKLDEEKGYAFKVANKYEEDISTSYIGTAFLIVSPIYGVVFNLEIKREHTVHKNVELSGTIVKEIETPFPEFPIFEFPLVDVYGKIGGFFRADADLSFSHESTQTSKSVFNAEVASYNFYIPHLKYNKLQPQITDKSETMINGSVSAGVFAEIGLCFWFIPPSLMKCGVRAEAGIKLEGNAVLNKTDTENAFHSTNLYNTLLDTNIQLKGFFNVGLQSKYFKFGASCKIDPLSKDTTLCEASPVPTFTNTKLEREEDSPTTLFASSKVSGYTLPVDIGYTLFEGDSSEGVAEEGITSYIYDYTGPNAEMYASFFDMKSTGGYTVYPTVKLWGVEMLADPKAEISLFSCPDDNHPHAIDLGLPSGTKWCCMNVGATAPEDYGGYYAWGETNEKSVYNDVTYQYNSGTDNDGDGWYEKNISYQNIGSDIAGTSYDVAHVKMGGSWVMPSITQQKELISNCTKEWTQQNGVIGTLVTGTNGRQIFLPEAGFYGRSGFCYEGEYGQYWSSSLYDYNDSFAYGLLFRSNDWRSFSYRYYGRCLGVPVRAVCP